MYKLIDASQARTGGRSGYHQYAKQPDIRVMREREKQRESGRGGGRERETDRVYRFTERETERGFIGSQREKQREGL